MTKCLYLQLSFDKHLEVFMFLLHFLNVQLFNFVCICVCLYEFVPHVCSA